MLALKIKEKQDKNPEYAKKIGADYYAKDAKMSADIAKEVL